MVLPQALSLLSAAFPPDRRGRVVGIFAGIIGLATLGGPVIGGAVVQGLAWQWIFWLNVPIGIALIPLTRRHVAESFGPRTRLDVTGLALSGAGVLGPVWGWCAATPSAGGPRRCTGRWRRACCCSPYSRAGSAVPARRWCPSASS